jgi:hypothetical protein
MSFFNSKGLISLILIVSSSVAFADQNNETTHLQIEVVASGQSLSDNNELKIKQLGELLEVRFSVTDIDPQTAFDIYIALEKPSESGQSQLWFVDSKGRLLETITPHLTDQTAWPGKATLISHELPIYAQWVGQYTFYAVLMAAGTESEKVLEASHWKSRLAADRFFLTRVK